MTIDKIAVEELWSTGVYANKRYRAEATIEPHEDLIECYKELQKRVEDAFVAANPQIQWQTPVITSCINDYPPIPETQIQKSNDQRRIEVMIKDMETVTDLEVLKSYEFLSRKYPEIKQAYENKLKALQNG